MWNFPVWVFIVFMDHSAIEIGGFSRESYCDIVREKIMADTKLYRVTKCFEVYK